MFDRLKYLPLPLPPLSPLLLLLFLSPFLATLRSVVVVTSLREFARRKKKKKEKVERVLGNDRLLFERRISSSIPSEVIVIYRCLREEEERRGEFRRVLGPVIGLRGRKKKKRRRCIAVINK